MKIAVCCKITPDVESVQVDGQGNVDFGRAQWEISQYDLQAIQAAMDIAQEGDEVVCVTVGNDQAVKSASVKALLSRGPHRLVGVNDEGCYEGDSAQTAQVLAAVAKREQFDIMVFGEGSADQYAQMTGLYTAALLGWPSANYVCGIKAEGDQVTVERDLEQGIQTCRVATPCTVSVTSTINDPKIPAMRAVLQAGKKPTEILSLADLGLAPAAENAVVIDASAPDMPDRRSIKVEGTPDEMAAQLITYLKQENVL